MFINYLEHLSFVLFERVFSEGRKFPSPDPFSEQGNKIDRTVTKNEACMR
jgi:hypothetical protein